MPTTDSFPIPLDTTFLLPQEPKSASDTPAPAGGAAPNTSGEAKVDPNVPQAGQPQQPCGGSEMLLYMGVFIGLMYFMVMRPEQKRRKEQQNLLTALKVGDRVVTISGLHGVVAKLDQQTVTLRVDTVQMTFDRVAVARIVRDEAAAAAKKA